MHMPMQQYLLVRQLLGPARAALVLGIGATGVGLGCVSSEHADGGTTADASIDNVLGNDTGAIDAGLGNSDVDGGGFDCMATGDAEGPTPPSCTAGGAGMCGCGANHESCCTSPIVTGGSYYRTYDGVTTFGSEATLAPDGGATGLADPATVSDFRLDKYLVTVGRFRAFVDAWNGGNGWLPAAGSGKHTHLNGGLGLANVADDAGVAYETGWVASDDSNIAPTDANLACNNVASDGTWTPAAGANERLPINCINWFEAYAFCIWDGGFLPSEAEWGYAAAGGAQQREYPWGSTFPGFDDQYAIYDCLYPDGPDGSDSCLAGVASIAPVGTASLGAGLWGQLDLEGEMSQLNLDFFALQYSNPCVDCAYLSPASDEGVDRGSNWNFPVKALYAATRQTFGQVKGARSSDVGFRCARSP